MTITTEEAEELAMGAFILMDDPPDLDDEIMVGSDFLVGLATALRSLAVERDALRAENARLREALRLAIDVVEFWAAYATPYFQDKHDLADDLQKLRATLVETQ